MSIHPSYTKFDRLLQEFRLSLVVVGGPLDHAHRPVLARGGGVDDAVVDVHIDLEPFSVPQKLFTGLRGSYGGVLMFGLVTSLFTMTVYDRVLPNNATESLIALSIGKVTSASISVGAMPGPSTRIVTVGAVRSGNTSTSILDAV